MALPFPVLTAEEAAELIKDGQKIGFSGFTAAGAAKAPPHWRKRPSANTTRAVPSKSAF